MKSTPTPWTHTGRTKQELIVPFGVGGRITHEITVPAGTTCHKLDGGTDPWVVADLRFLPDKHSILYSDASIYGIRIQENDIADITEVEPVRRERQRG